MAKGASTTASRADNQNTVRYGAVCAITLLRIFRSSWLGFASAKGKRFCIINCRKESKQLAGTIVECVLQKPFIGKAEIPFIRDDEMVEDLDIERI